MQSGIIKEVLEKSSKDKTKVFFEVVLTDGTKMSTFDEKIKTGAPGDGIDFEVKVNGKYINLLDGWKLTKHSSSTSETRTLSNNRAENPDTRISIENMSCMKGIFDLRIAGILTDASSEFHGALRWASNHFTPLKTDSDKAFEKLESAGKPLVPGSNDWILLKVKELSIDVPVFMEYINKTLHIPIEDTLDKTLHSPILTEKNRADIAKAINAREKKKE
jgi:hypothetical protein